LGDSNDEARLYFGTHFYCSNETDQTLYHFILIGTNDENKEIISMQFIYETNGVSYQNNVEAKVDSLIRRGYHTLKLSLKVKFSMKKDPKVNAEIQKIAALLSDSKNSDFTCIVGNRSFKVHKSILAAASPVFDRMFSVPMVEAQTNEVKIEVIEPNIFEHLLQFVYGQKLPQNLFKVVVDLFKAAHYYEVKDLMEICEDEIEEKLTIENAIQFYELAYVYDVKNLKENVWSFIKR
jgi:hypothetical protein